MRRVWSRRRKPQRGTDGRTTNSGEFFSLPVVLRFITPKGPKDFTENIEDKEHNFKYKFASEPLDFRFDPDYPDLTTPRTDDFVLVEILLSVGRSVKVKRKILADILSALAKAPGLNPEHVMVCFKETAWENWAFGGGRIIHA